MTSEASIHMNMLYYSEIQWAICMDNPALQSVPNVWRPDYSDSGGKEAQGSQAKGTSPSKTAEAWELAVLKANEWEN